MFKVIIGQEELMEALKKIKSTAVKEKEAGVQSGKSVYMETFINSASKLRLRLITSNTDDISDIDIEVIKGDVGVCSLVDYDLLTSMISTILPTLEITMEDDEDDYKLSISYIGRKKPIVINGMSSDKYILPVEQLNTVDVVLPIALLKEGLDMGSAVIDDSTTLPMWNCLSIVIDKNRISFSALGSSSKRMFLSKRVLASPAPDVKTFIECNKVKKIISGFDTTTDITMHLYANSVIFEQDDLKKTTRLLAGNFPDTSQFFPSQYNCEVVMDKGDIMASLKRASLMTESSQSIKSVVFDISGGFVNINLNSKVGDLCECVICNINGPDVKMSFLLESIMASIASVDNDRLKMCFYNNKSCIVKPLTNKGVDNYFLTPAVVTRV